MPYIVTTQRTSDERGVELLSRRAVATLEEAQDAAQQIVYDGPPIRVKTEWELICMVIADMPESGGSVGPLPDGTVIEVERVDWPRMATIAGYGGNPSRLIAAFNSRQR